VATVTEKDVEVGTVRNLDPFLRGLGILLLRDHRVDSARPFPALELLFEQRGDPARLDISHHRQREARGTVGRAMETDEVLTRQRPNFSLTGLDRTPLERVPVGVDRPGQCSEGKRVGLLALPHEAAEDLLAQLVELLRREGGAPQHLDQETRQTRQLLGQPLGGEGDGDGGAGGGPNHQLQPVVLELPRELDAPVVGRPAVEHGGREARHRKAPVGGKGRARAQGAGEGHRGRVRVGQHHEPATAGEAEARHPLRERLPRCHAAPPDPSVEPPPFSGTNRPAVRLRSPR